MCSSTCKIKFITLIALISSITNYPQVDCQRSFLLWKRDLELRLNSYQQQRYGIQDLLTNSINPARQPINGWHVVKGANVRFSELIIPHGALILDTHDAGPSVQILMDKTKHYINSKLTDLNNIRNHLGEVLRKFQQESNRYIDKGTRELFLPHMNTIPINGTRVFHHVQFAHSIDTYQTHLHRVNYTMVEKVLDDVYMKNSDMIPRDQKGRIYFEGRKVLGKSVFTRQLRSGCCDRLLPIHTDRMMTRSTNQTIVAPIVLHSNNNPVAKPAVITNLISTRVINRRILTTIVNNITHEVSLIPSPVENVIHIDNLIDIRTGQQPEILKRLVMKTPIKVEYANIDSPFRGNRPIISIESEPGREIDLAHEKYLLKYAKQNLIDFQYVRGPLYVNTYTDIVDGVYAENVNQEQNFQTFAREMVVRVDRDSVIRGQVHFNALPHILNPNQWTTSPPNAIDLLRVSGQMYVGALNGMRIPRDIVFLPQLRIGGPIRVRGPRVFSNNIICRDFLNVGGQVNGIHMPAGVIPLHLNDFMSSVGSSNLWFVDGIIAPNSMIIDSGRLDDMDLKGISGDADSLILKSVFEEQPDGSHVIRASLHVDHLSIIGQLPGRGLLNGFRPQDVISLYRRPIDVISSNKTFLGLVEADECHFNNINHFANWTNHLIRIDRPGTVQNIAAHLTFESQPNQLVPANSAYMSPQALYDMTTSVYIERLRLEFHQNTDRLSYMNNMKMFPELYIMHQALMRGTSRYVDEKRYRVLEEIRIINKPVALVNGIDINDIITLDKPFKFSNRFTMVGKVEVHGSLRANQIKSNYPIGSMDLVQFNKYRVPVTSLQAIPIKLNNLVLASNNQASYIQTLRLNGELLNEFLSSMMSLTRPQVVDSNLVFGAPVNLDGMVRTESAVNEILDFGDLCRRLTNVKYIFEDGLQCDSVELRD